MFGEVKGRKSAMREYFTGRVEEEERQGIGRHVKEWGMRYQDDSWE